MNTSELPSHCNEVIDDLMSFTDMVEFAINSPAEAAATYQDRLTTTEVEILAECLALYVSYLQRDLIEGISPEEPVEMDSFLKYCVKGRLQP